MTKDVTREDRERMNTLLSDIGALRRVQKLHHDANTGQVLAAILTNFENEYDGLARRARAAAQERMARARAAKSKPGDHEGGEANA